jgi:hypothetical protein
MMGDDMIDPSKVKVGDELVFQRATVMAIDDRGYYQLSGPHIGLFHPKWFTRHISAPRPFEKGDKVTWGTGRIAYEFVAEHDGYVVMFDPMTGETPRRPVADVRHADAPPERDIVVTDADANRAQDVYAATLGGSVLSWRAALTDFLKRRKESGR